MKLKITQNNVLENIATSVILAIIFNIFIFILSFMLSFNYGVNFNSNLSIYYASFYGVLGVYVTLMGLSLNLSNEIPTSVSFKHFIFSKISLTYLFGITINIIMFYSMHITKITENIISYFMFLSYILLFVFSIILLLIFFHYLQLKNIIKIFFNSIMKEYKNKKNVIIPKKIMRNFIIENTDKYIHIKNRYLKPNDISSDKDEQEIENNNKQDLNVYKIKKHKNEEDIFYLMSPKGKLVDLDLTFLKDYTNEIIEILIFKYNFANSFGSYNIVCKYVKNKNNLKEIKEVIMNSNKYEYIDLIDFKNVYDKLEKNGSEEYLEELVENYISNSIKGREEKIYLIEAFLEIINNKEKSFNKKISKLYKLKYLFLDDLGIIDYLQGKLLNELLTEHLRSEKFNPKLMSGSLNIKEFLDIRYIDKFEKNKNLNWIKEYDVLMKNTIERIFSLCKNILDLEIDNGVKKKYFNEYLNNLNKVLEHYKHFHINDICPNYYSYRNGNLNNEELELKTLSENKMNIIENNKNYIIEKEKYLFYLIFYYIENTTLDKSFFPILLKIFESEEFNKKYYQAETDSDLDWLNFNRFETGAQFIAEFNYTKYNLILSFYNYINSGEIDIEKFSKEFFGEYKRYPFEKEIDNINENLIKLYFDNFNLNQLNEYKNDVMSIINKKKEEYKNEEVKYIIETPLKEEFVDKFKEDCKNLWKELQDYLEKIFLVKYEDNVNNKVKEFFGLYKLFEKKWFIDSYDNNIGYARDTGNLIGSDQIHSKKIQIINKIDNMFNSKYDKEIVVNDLFTNIKDNIENGQEYYLFHNSTIGIYKLPNITWTRDYWQKAKIKIDDSIINIFFIQSNQTIMFKKGDFKLIQYNQGYENENEMLFAEVEELKDEVEIQKIIDSDQNKWKTPNEVKQYVKIRVAEKFEIKRNPNAKIVRFVK